MDKNKGRPMRASRRTQPYRKGARQPGFTLEQMLKGAPVFLPNPMDLQRLLMKQARRRRGRR